MSGTNDGFDLEMNATLAPYVELPALVSPHAALPGVDEFEIGSRDESADLHLDASSIAARRSGASTTSPLMGHAGAVVDLGTEGSELAAIPDQHITDTGRKYQQPPTVKMRGRIRLISPLSHPILSANPHFVSRLFQRSRSLA